MVFKIRPVVFCGPSGSGKSTLLKRLMAEYPNAFAFSVSHTTRKPRPGEENGKDYHYVSREEILAGIENGEFLEYAEFSGNYYGTSKKAVETVLSSGRICALDVDIQGVKNLKKTDLNPVYLFIKPPSLETLETRLRERGTETEDSTINAWIRLNMSSSSRRTRRMRSIMLLLMIIWTWLTRS